VRALLELVAPSVCPGCDRARREDEPLLCTGCAAGLVPAVWQGADRAALHYQGSAAELVRRWKFEQRRDALPVLLEPLCACVADLELDVLVAIPRHRERVRAEGCDPVHALATALARASGVPFAPRLLLRSRAAPPQAELPRRARHANVRRSFRARPGGLRGLRALLIDDVTTTGATLREAARELGRHARPRSLVRVALAATPSPGSDGVL
jgi:predicted amidophosphoribosyltransferase